MNNATEKRERPYVPFDESYLYRDDQLSQDQWRELALTDTITGLKSRHWWDRYSKKLYQEIVSTRRRNLSFLLIDVDNLGILNDLFGHPEVDKILGSIGSIARHPKIGFRQGDIPVRMSGDELGVLLPFSDLRMANAAAHRVLLEIRTLSNKYGGLPITVSIGVADSEMSGVASAEELYKLADIACSHAKKTKDRIVTYVPKMVLVQHKKR